jgi:hypothetical protein
MHQQLSMIFVSQASPPRLACERTDRIAQQIVDVSEQARDPGILYRVSMSVELHDILLCCHPGDRYECEIVLWDVLMLAEFEHTLNMLVPAFTFTATIWDLDYRLRFTAGDPVLIEIVNQNFTRRFP